MFPRWGCLQLIKVENLCQTFFTPQGPIEVLKNVNFEVNSGEILGIYGPSGAGKTTLLRCLALAQRPTSGRIFFQGEEVQNLSGKSLRDFRRRISLVYQGFNLLMSRDAISNVTLPLEIQGFKKSEALARAKEMLDLVGVGHRQDSYPEALSGGEKQRVAIARALITQPQVLIMDEPTSALDEKTARSVLSLIQNLNSMRKITVILVTHQVRLVHPICKRALFLSDGRLVPWREEFLEDEVLPGGTPSGHLQVVAGCVSGGQQLKVVS